MKSKKCKNCKKIFVPERQMQSCCSFECSIEWAKKLQQKSKEKKANKIKKDFKANDKVLLRKKIQAIANKYGKILDYNRWLVDGCITCGIKTGKVDGGHFLPTSTYPSIRYYAKQIKCQCIGCNQYRGGMPIEYDLKMRELYGNELVDNLRLNHRVNANYSVEYMKKYIRVIGKRIKQLELRLNIL